MIPRDFKLELLGKIDIVDVIDSYVPLKKAGANYIACCPFHHEKTPSFTVSREKQFYYCFGCQVSGNAITFMMDYVGLGYVEAVEKLASLAGLSVPRVKGDFNFEKRQVAKQKEEILKDYNLQIANYFFTKKYSMPIAMQYLEKRGLSEDVIQTYRIGYAPDGNYIQEIFSDTTSYPDLVAGGLLSEKEQRYFPRFKDRIMFPIRDIDGNVLGFGGRIMDKGEPKYLNSPETILFNKSQCLYGIYEAKKNIKAHNKALVVEGYMDVAALAQYGIDYAVATLGTATTGQHIRLLFRFTHQIYFCFDGDEAGRKAAWRALTNSLEYLKDDKILYFVFLPEGEDPDSYIRTLGYKGFESFIDDNAMPLSQYFIQYLTQGKKLEVGEIKVGIIKSVKPLLSQIKSQNLKFMLTKELAGRLQIDIHELQHLIGDEVQSKVSNSYRQGRFGKSVSKKIEVTPYNRKMIYWLLINPRLAPYTELPDYLEYSQDIQCLLVLSNAIRMNSQVRNAVQLQELFRDTNFSTLINSILAESFHENNELLEGENIEENFKYGIEKIKQEITKSEIFQLKDLMYKRELSSHECELLKLLLDSEC